MRFDTFTDAENYVEELEQRVTDLEVENDILRERLLERNNVMRRLIKLRSAIMQLVDSPVANNIEPWRDPVWDDKSFDAWEGLCQALKDEIDEYS